MALTANYGVRGDLPSPVIWNRADIYAALKHGNAKMVREDFTSFGKTTAVSSNVGRYCGQHQWYSYEDTGDAITQLATNDNGVCNISIAATNNNESWIQPGDATSVMCNPKTAANGGKPIYFEARVNMSTLVGNMFVGLSEEGLAAADTIADANGTLADKDYIGFLVDEDAPTVCRFVYHKASGTANSVISSAHTFVADEFVKLGFILNPNDNDPNKVGRVYINGVEQGTYITKTLYENTTDFPTGEELNPLFGGKNNNAAKVVRADWIWCFQERYEE